MGIHQNAGPLRSQLVRKEAFGEVVERELEVLYRVARRLTLNATAAEDLVAQTMFLAASSWAAFDGRYPRSWLVKIMRNEWLSTLRKPSTRRETPMEENLEPSDEGFWCSIDNALDAKAIVDALDNLPEEYRLAVALCDVEEMSYEEAAESMGVPIGTVRSRLFRGRKLLRSRLVRLDPRNQTFA